MTQLDWASQLVTKAQGFDAAFDVLECGGGDLSRGVAIASRFPSKRVCASDFKLSNTVICELDELRLPNLRAESVDVREMPFRDNSFDFVFSVALMEHVAELDTCLEEMHRILRPGGFYYFIQSPIWSCAQGHHYRHWDDASFAAIPLFGHLTHSADEMRIALEAASPPFPIDDCIDSIYTRRDLSRLSRNQTRALVDDSPRKVIAWDDYSDRRYDRDAADAAFPKVRFPIERSELEIGGAYVTLQKPTS